jgi:hypothetical protein
MNPDIRKAVEVINNRIENLEHIKAMLLEEFGAGSVLGEMATSDSRPRLLRADIGANGNGGGEGRRAQLARFLRHHGPARRTEINTKSGIPKGTIAFLLNKWPEFVSRRGKWQLAIEEDQSTIVPAAK